MGISWSMLEVLITDRLMRKFSEVPAVGNGINNNCSESSLVITYTNDHASVESKYFFQIFSIRGLLHCFSRKNSEMFFFFLYDDDLYYT